jgi:hypothetical protein
VETGFTIGQPWFCRLNATRFPRDAFLGKHAIIAVVRVGSALLGVLSDDSIAPDKCRTGDETIEFRYRDGKPARFAELDRQVDIQAMGTRLVILIAAGCLLAGSLLIWLQLPNRSSNYLARWVVQDLREQSGAASVPIPVDMRSRVWPTAIGIGLFLSGVALFATAMGINVRRRWSPVVSRLGVKHAVALAVVLAIAIVAFWRSAFIHYHKVAMRSWHALPSPFWDRHQQALVALGYFQRREFALEHRALTNSGEFMRFVEVAPFRNDQWMLAPHSNRVDVTAYRGDMKAWAEVVRRFDSGEPVGPHEPPSNASDALEHQTSDSLRALDSSEER